MAALFLALALWAGACMWGRYNDQERKSEAKQKKEEWRGKISKMLCSPELLSDINEPDREQEAIKVLASGAQLYLKAIQELDEENPPNILSRDTTFPYDRWHYATARPLHHAFSKRIQQAEDLGFFTSEQARILSKHIEELAIAPDCPLIDRCKDGSIETIMAIVIYNADRKNPANWILGL